MGTTVRVASILEDGHTFQDSLTPVRPFNTAPVTLSRILTIAFLDVLKV